LNKDTSISKNSDQNAGINSIFVNVKIKIIITLCAGLFLLTACPETTSKSPLELIQENNMDLPQPVGFYHEGLNFKLSNLFERSSYDNMVIQDDAAVRVIPQLSLYFTVESFTQSEADAYAYSFDTEIDALDAVHDVYSEQRLNTLDEFTISIKKAVPKSVKYPGYFQVISGSRYENDLPTTYFLATIQVGSKYYVFQLIGKEDNMGYLHDDFIEILSSIE
jgi:hypothetical protein